MMGGSFNPVHIGHLMVASYIAQTAGLDGVLLSMSPANPLKEGTHPVDDAHRLAMLRIAVGNDPRLEVTDIELALPRPSYTLTLLDELSRRNPDTDFVLIIGSDNWQVFDRWRAHEEIIARYGVIVYPRPGYDVVIGDDNPGVRLVDAPTVNLSSTFVRESIAAGLDMNFFLPAGVFDYIKKNELYGNSDT